MIATTAAGICWLRSVAHVSCPTCGITRSLELLARGDVAGSLALHPWGLALAAQALLALAVVAAWGAGRLRERPDRWVPHIAAFNAAALVVVWAARLASGTLPP